MDRRDDDDRSGRDERRADGWGEPIAPMDVAGRLAGALVTMDARQAHYVIETLRLCESRRRP